MFDRDARPDDRSEPSEESDRLRVLCAEMARPWPFPGHQLGRRTIENYLPLEALRAWAESSDGVERARRRRQVEAFASSDFGAKRRACFAMKEGFLKDVAKDVREDFKQRRRKRRKRGKLEMRERWLEEHELPAIFQGLQSKAFDII